MTSFVVYTALFGEYDVLEEPPERYEGCDFVCFTDLNLSSDIWRIVRVEPDDISPVFANRLYKMFPHLYLSEYDASLYVDANVRLVGNPVLLVEKYLRRTNIAAPTHPNRRTVFSEMVACASHRKCAPFVAFNQLLDYKIEGFRDSYGLTANNVLLRQHNSPQVVAAMDLWWKEFSTKTPRDQLSLQFCLWKCKTDITLMDESPWGDGLFFSYSPHSEHVRRNISVRLMMRISSIARMMLYLPLFTLLFKARIKV